MACSEFKIEQMFSVVLDELSLKCRYEMLYVGVMYRCNIAYSIHWFSSFELHIIWSLNVSIMVNTHDGSPSEMPFEA